MRPTQSSGLPFGAPASTASTGLSFGSIPPISGGLSFSGTSVGQPAAGVSFGAPATSTSLFGTSSFGAPAQSSGLSFGQPTNQPSALSFGATPVSQTGVSFGQPATSTALSGFGMGMGQTSNVSFGGLAASTAPTGFSLGAPTATLGSSFGAPATTPATSLGFGTVATTGLGLGFGAPNVTAPSSVGFGVSTSAPTGLSFGLTAPVTATGLTFGTAPATSSALGFQGLTTSAAKPLTLSFGATPTTAPTGLSLSLVPTSTQPPAFGLGGLPTQTGLFGTTAAKPLTLGLAPTSAATGLSFAGTSLGTSTASSLTFNAAVSAAPSLGLGGIETAQSKAGHMGSGTGRTDTKAVKENLIPNEIIQTIDGFKSFVKAQKGLSSDIARGSIKQLDKVREDTEALKKLLAKITTGLQKNRSMADHLKAQTATAIRNAEMAQRTHDTPPGLQYDNVAPLQYFMDLVASFEQEMQSFRQEIEKTEKHIKSLTEPRPLTPQELNLAMKRLHDSFVALAGRLQTVHNSVETQKDQYSNLRKYFLKDSSNVFQEPIKPVGVHGRPIMANRISLGPTPFSPMGSQHGYGLLPAGNNDTPTSYPSGNQIGWSGGQPLQTSTNFAVGGSGLGSNNMYAPLSASDNQSFMLQKPPLGTKRGKH